MFTIIIHYRNVRNPSLADKMSKTEKKNLMNILLHILCILLYLQTPAMLCL